MTDFEKLNDSELDAVSGGQKYTVGNIPVPVKSYPAGPVIYTLTRGDYLVTDGNVLYVNGAAWYHVYTAFGEGCVDGRYL